MAIKALHINCHKSQTASVDVVSFVSLLEHEYIVFLQEVNSRNGIIQYLPKKNLYYNKGSNGRIRAAIMHSEYLHIWPRPDFTTSDIATVILKCNEAPTEIYLGPIMTSQEVFHRLSWK